MGPTGFLRFNDLIVAPSGPTASRKPDQLLEIGRAGMLSITYEPSARPPLKRAP